MGRWVNTSLCLLTPLPCASLLCFLPGSAACAGPGLLWPPWSRLERDWFIESPLGFQESSCGLFLGVDESRCLYPTWLFVYETIERICFPAAPAGRDRALSICLGVEGHEGHSESEWTWVLVKKEAARHQGHCRTQARVAWLLCSSPGAATGTASVIAPCMSLRGAGGCNCWVERAPLVALGDGWVWPCSVVGPGRLKQVTLSSGLGSSILSISGVSWFRGPQWSCHAALPCGSLRILLQP